MKKTLSIAIVLVLMTDPALPQSGGPYDLSHSVIATGGGSNSIGGTFRVDGTIGQSVAGTSSRSVSGPVLYDLYGGFWFQNLIPTSASVSISGRVSTAYGGGVRNARLTLTASDGTRRTVTTSAFGYYTFDAVEVGHAYVLEIASKHFTFANSTLIFNLQDELTGMNFTALP